MSKLKVLIFFSILVLFVFIFKMDISNYLNIEFFLNEKDKLLLFYKNQPLVFIIIYFCFYVFCATFSIPGAAILTLTSGFLFGFVIGSLVVSLGSTTGAVFSFLISRFLLKDFIQKKFAKKLKRINEGLKKDGLFYMLSLRLVPIFPYVLINLLMGVTPISLKQYTIGSFLGMLPMTFVFVNAGKQLSHIQSVSEIFSGKIILSFFLLAILPWLLKLLIKKVNKRNLIIS